MQPEGLVHLVADEEGGVEEASPDDQAGALGEGQGEERSLAIPASRDIENTVLL